jgi:hypothetical protein
MANNTILMISSFIHTMGINASTQGRLQYLTTGLSKRIFRLPETLDINEGNESKNYRLHPVNELN